MSDRPADSLLLDNQFCFVLYAASRKMIQQYAPMLKALDLTYTQYIVLMLLWEHQALPVKKLGEYLLLDTGTLTPLLKKLETKELVTRARSKEDERSVLIELTDRGAALKSDAVRLLPSLLCSMPLDSGELVDLRERLKRFLVDLNTCK